MSPQRVVSWLMTILLLTWGMAAAPSLAQIGLGAERYEVTITPPKRPGTEAPVDAEGTADPAPAATAPPETGEAVPAADTASREAAAPSGSAAPAAPAIAAASGAPLPKAPAAAKPASDLPQKTLQVGAFRHKDSAADLREALVAGFQDVSIVEVESGGEPLYRVIVGKQPHGPSLDDLKRRLAAAGHPAFEVPAPPASAAH